MEKPVKRSITIERKGIRQARIGVGFLCKRKISHRLQVEGSRVAKLSCRYAAQPAEQFGQGVLNTPLPSPQELGGLPLLLAQSPLAYKIFQETQTPTAQAQQPTTIGSLLNSAATSTSSLTNNNPV